MNKSIFVIGPTTSGKTHLAVQLASYLNGEIISADSRQIYRGLDIGTGKDLHEYVINNQSIAYHMIDIKSFDEDFSVFDFYKYACQLEIEINSRNKISIVSGGSSLYLSSLINAYQFSEKNIEFKDSFQDRLILVPYFHRNLIHKRIELRLKERWNAMIGEVQILIKKGMTYDKLEYLGLEYRYIKRLLSKELDESTCFEQLLIKIRNFARRQDIWIRKLERQGHTMYFLDKEDKFEQAKILANKFLNNEKLPLPTISLLDIYYGPKS